MLPRILVLCLCLLFASISVFAQALNAPVVQTPDATQADDAQQKAQAEKEERERKAWALLDDVMEQANGLRRAENRAFAQWMTANLLWGHDEKRAREMYRNALASVAEQFNSVDISDPQYQQHIQPLIQLRAQLLQTLAQHDAKLALELLRATRPPDWSSKRANQYDQETQLENNILQQIALNDPQQAVKTAEDLLKRGFPYQLTNLLQQIQSKDPEAAAQIVGEIITNLHSANLANNQEDAQMAINLAQIGAQLNSDATQSSGGKSPYITAQNTRDLFEMIAAAATTPSRNGYNILAQAQSLMPNMQKFAPASIAPLQQRLAAMHLYQNDGSDVWNKFYTLLNSGNVDGAMDYVSNVAPEMRDGMYQQIAWNMSSKGDLEQARQLINDHIANPAQRAQMLANLEQQAAQREAVEGKIAEARQHLSALRSDEARAAALVQLAFNVMGKNKDAASQLLDEAQSLIAGRARNMAQMQAQINVAGAYAQLDSPRGFEILEPTIDQLNDLLAAEAVLEDFTNNRGAIKDDEFTLQNGYGTALSLFNQYAQQLARLARFDFDRAVSIANRTQRPELRLYARLLIAQSILNPSNVSVRYFNRRGTLTGSLHVIN